MGVVGGDGGEFKLFNKDPETEKAFMETEIETVSFEIKTFLIMKIRKLPDEPNSSQNDELHVVYKYR